MGCDETLFCVAKSITRAVWEPVPIFIGRRLCECGFRRNLAASLLEQARPPDCSVAITHHIVRIYGNVNMLASVGVDSMGERKTDFV